MSISRPLQLPSPAITQPQGQHHEHQPPLSVALQSTGITKPQGQHHEAASAAITSNYKASKPASWASATPPLAPCSDGTWFLQVRWFNRAKLKEFWWVKVLGFRVGLRVRVFTKFLRLLDGSHCYPSSSCGTTLIVRAPFRNCCSALDGFMGARHVFTLCRVAVFWV